VHVSDPVVTFTNDSRMRGGKAGANTKPVRLLLSVTF